MIIAKAPMRLSFVGGGSDLPTFLEKSGTGRVVTTTLNKFVYVIIKERVFENHRIVYSDIEVVENFEKIKHEIIRNALKYLNIGQKLEMYSIADLPAKGTGLGASSAFTLALMAGLKRFQGESISNLEAAELASFVEMKLCMKSSGFQDQYASAIGGLAIIDFDIGGYSQHKLMSQGNSKDFLTDLNKHVAFVHVPGSRNSETILERVDYSLDSKTHIQEEIRDLTDQFEGAIKTQDYRKMGSILSLNWRLKKELNSFSTNDVVENLYNIGIKEGAYGGKLLGAGQAGYIMFVVEDNVKFFKSTGFKDLGIRISGEKMEVVEL